MRSSSFRRPTRARSGPSAQPSHHNLSRPANVPDAPIEVRMPKLADTLVEGTVARWYKRAGDNVQRGEPLAAIETDKVSTDLESPSSGTVLELLVAEGQVTAVENVIARIGSSALGEPSSVAASPAAPAASVKPTSL